MIRIPASELLGVLGDTIPFAAPDDDHPTLHSVRLEWDGDMLHALATDRICFAWSRWHPDDAPAEDQQENLLDKWGGGDDPWAILLPLKDASDIVRNFKVSTKQGWTPLTLDCYSGSLKVARSADTGLSALVQTIEGYDGDFPNMRKLLTTNPELVDGLAFNAVRLATFAKVRQRDPMRLTFTGTTSPALVSIGDRFSGLIMPVREKADDEDGGN